MAVDGIVVSLTKAQNNRDITILKVSGYLDTTTASELENALASLLKNHQYKIVVDLSGVTYISSAGWGIFIGEIKRIRSQGGDLKLVGMIPDVHEVFLLLEFQTILDAFPTIVDAVAAFESGASPRSERDNGIEAESA